MSRDVTMSRDVAISANPSRAIHERCLNFDVASIELFAIAIDDTNHRSVLNRRVLKRNSQSQCSQSH
ncbi:hypothetical protein TSUD_123500 [Trifolium subterraneum]|uniref:Uncharacterized protein n=1 Tax=Trifolium subterraneum TaxID=3900 RepID=A0A2Z6LY87_TRISU|nr:hypothetical protein TSUD_123500 [Trifolium subterraneum]